MAYLSIDRIRIELPAEVQAIKEAYRGTVGRIPLAATGEMLARRRVRVVFRAKDRQTSATIGNRQYILHPFAEAFGRAYWVGCELELAPKLGSYEFSSIGLIILLQGAGDEMLPLLRAEWERSRDHPPGQHAQPHWHVYMTSMEHQSRTHLIAFENDEWKSYGDDWAPIGQSQVAPTEQQSVVRFHLAMASRWHLQTAHPQYEVPDHQRLGPWVTGCLAYVRAQLLYISESFSPRLPF